MIEYVGVRSEAYSLSCVSVRREPSVGIVGILAQAGSQRWLKAPAGGGPKARNGSSAKGSSSQNGSRARDAAQVSQKRL